jgi:hypothetical protein
MNKETYWREFLGYFRFNMIIFFLLAVVNWICLVRTDLELTTFLIWMNGTVWIGMMILLAVLDIYKDKILRWFRK